MNIVNSTTNDKPARIEIDRHPVARLSDGGLTVTMYSEEGGQFSMRYREFSTVRNALNLMADVINLHNAKLTNDDDEVRIEIESHPVAQLSADGLTVTMYSEEGGQFSMLYREFSIVRNALNLMADVILDNLHSAELTNDDDEAFA